MKQPYKPETLTCRGCCPHCCAASMQCVEAKTGSGSISFQPSLTAGSTDTVCVLCRDVLCLCFAGSRFPRMGPQVFLRMPVLKRDKPVRIEFMAFGGGWVDQTLKRAMEASPHTGVFVCIYVCHALVVATFLSHRININTGTGTRSTVTLTDGRTWHLLSTGEAATQYTLPSKKCLSCMAWPRMHTGVKDHAKSPGFCTQYRRHLPPNYLTHLPTPVHQAHLTPVF